jgi:hypothetical protein
VHGLHNKAKGVFGMVPELSSRGELTKPSQLCGIFGDIVHFFRVPLLQL